MARSVALLGLVLACVAARGAAAGPSEHLGVHPGVHLSWVRDDAASDCPDAAAIETEVAGRLGDNPFLRAATQFIEASVTRQGDRFEVTIAMRGPDGRPIGNRSLASRSGDCRSIATAAALTIAILIDPDAIVRVAPPRPPVLAPPPPPAPGQPAGPQGRVSALAAVGWGSLPGLAPGVELAATVDLARRAALGVSGAFFPERRASAPNDGFAFGLASAEAVGCFVAVGGGPSEGRGGLRWELCAGLSLGVLHAVVDAPTPLNPGQRWALAATELTRLVIPVPVLGPALVEVGLEAAEAFPRRSFFVEGRPAGMDTVFTQPVVSVTGAVGVGLRWR